MKSVCALLIYFLFCKVINNNENKTSTKNGIEASFKYHIMKEEFDVVNDNKHDLLSAHFAINYHLYFYWTKFLYQIGASSAGFEQGEKIWYCLSLERKYQMMKFVKDERIRLESIRK